MTAQPDTEIKIVVGQGAEAIELSTWESYEIEADVLHPANAFSVTASNNDGELAGVVGKGDPVKVLVDGAVQMAGHVDDVTYTSSDDAGASVQIVGRDLFGHLVDCSAPLKCLHKITIADLAQELAGDWVDTWTAPLSIGQIAKVKIEPGDNIWEVLERFAEKEKLLLWLDPSGVGVIGKPNYTQPPAYQLWHLARSNPRAKTHNNVIASTVTESWRELFSEITVYGTTGNMKATYGTGARSRAVALETMVDDRPLRLVDGDCKTLAQAQAKASAERDRRAFEALKLEYTVRGHYGYLGSSSSTTATLWQVDTIVDVEDELSGYSSCYYLSRRRFRGGDEGRFTDLELHPMGVWLT